MDKLTESRLRQLAGLNESPEGEVDKAVEKALGTDEVFLTGETIRDSKAKKLFVPVAALNAGNKAQDANDDAALEAAIKPARGKIFAVTFQPNRGKGKINYDIVVLGDKAQAQKMSKAFLSVLTAKLQGVTLGKEKVLKSESRDKSRNELVTISDHPFLDDVWVIESEIPFTLG
jgi:hypothetical protein